MDRSAETVPPLVVVALLMASSVGVFVKVNVYSNTLLTPRSKRIKGSK